MLKESYLVLAFQDAKRLPLTAGYPIPHGFSVVYSDGQFPCGFIMAPAIDPLTSRFTQHDEEGRIVSLVVHSIGAVLISAYAPVEGPKVSSTASKSNAKECNGPFWESLRTAVTDSKAIKGRVHVLGDMNAHVSSEDLVRYEHDPIPGTPDRYPKVTNNNGQQALKLCHTTDLSIMPHAKGLQYTFMGTGIAGPSVTDYLMVTYAHAKEITSHAAVDSPARGSNHSMLIYQCRPRRESKRRRERSPPKDPFTAATAKGVIDEQYEALIEILRADPTLPTLPTKDEPGLSIPPPITSSVESANVRHLRNMKADAIASSEASGSLSKPDTSRFDALIEGCIAGETIGRAAALADFLEDALRNHRYDLVYRACRQMHAPGSAKSTPLSVREKLASHYTELLKDPTPVHLRPGINIPNTPLEDAPPRVPQDHEVEIFTDGSVSADGRGTWAVHCPSLNIHLCGKVPISIFGIMNQNDPMHSFATEAWAILMALRNIPLARVRIITDNEGCAFRVNSLTRLEKTDFENIEIFNVWRAIAAAARPTHLLATWVRGHGVEEGNRCAASFRAIGQHRQPLRLCRLPTRRTP